MREVPIASYVMEYAARLTLATHPEYPSAPPLAKQYLRYGASPRAAQTLVLAAKAGALLEGRYNVSYKDIRRVAKPALRHRIIPNLEAELAGMTADTLSRNWSSECHRKSDRSRDTPGGPADCQAERQAATKIRYRESLVVPGPPKSRAQAIPFTTRGTSPPGGARTAAVDEVFLSQLRHVSLAPQPRHTNGLTGEHSSPRRSNALEFTDYRNYAPGDDLRRVDWNAYVRLASSS